MISNIWKACFATPRAIPPLPACCQGEVLADAMQGYFQHYGLEALLLDTSEVHAGFIDTGRFALWCQVWSPHSR
ncbi:hypothetical protein HORIV_69210 [Vreelandella olivaria]|uniref:Uncharacterized protein n=1 Tax=Vreelandella olivaria TaxID=390919 RepID=A0ABN5XCQ5_9GAMM|nr:hypothetical protein HORIV_69210 [Halomonas olivaria]